MAVDLKHNSVCNICHHKGNRLLFRKDGFEIVRCLNCRVVYVYPMLSKEEISEIYEDQSYYDSIITHDKRSMEDRFPWDDILSYIANITGKKGKLLDVGSGTGFFLDLAQRQGWEVIGIEPSSFVYNFSRCKYNVNVINRSLKEADIMDSSFDVVTLWNVLEHIEDPLDILMDVKNKIKFNGLIAFSVPNIDSSEAKLFKEKWNALDPRNKGHVHFFSRYTINYILTKIGLKSIKIFSLGGFGFRSHILERNNTNYNRKIFILEHLAALIRFILGKLNKGGILIVVARKK